MKREAPARKREGRSPEIKILDCGLVFYLTITLDEEQQPIGATPRHFPHGQLKSGMEHEFHKSQPIYRQLRDGVAHMILDGVLNEGDPLPSVRTVAAEYRVNPLTVLKAYQGLVEEELVETKRGLGMFVRQDARAHLLAGEREKFLSEEWPRIAATIERLGLTTKELEAAANPPARRSGKEKP
jgi:GntR family transcriptional regulator